MAFSESPPPTTLTAPERGHGFRQRHRAFVERRHLEHAHGSVPDDRLRGRDHFRILFDGLGSDVQPHLPVRNRSITSLVRACLHLRRTTWSTGSISLSPASAISLRARSILSSSTSDLPVDSPRARKKRVRHRAADHQPVHDLHQVLNHFDLVGHLRAAQNRDARPRRIPGRLGQIFEFLVHQQAGGRLLDEGDHPHGGGVRAMRRAERVVHVNVAERARAAAKIRDRSFLPPRESAGFRAAALRRARAAWPPLPGRCNPAPWPPGCRAVAPGASATGFRLISGLGLPLGRPGGWPESRPRRGRARIEWWAATP